MFTIKGFSLYPGVTITRVHCNWNTGLIAVGAILFVGGLVLAVILVVLLVMRIKASCMLQ